MLAVVDERHARADGRLGEVAEVEAEDDGAVEARAHLAAVEMRYELSVPKRLRRILAH